jgi:hypothetical protein
MIPRPARRPGKLLGRGILLSPLKGYTSPVTTSRTFFLRRASRSVAVRVACSAALSVRAAHAAPMGLVTCFAAPCLHKTAACVSGKCVAK